MDLKQDYLQVVFAEKSRNLTALVSHEGVFRFKRLPFGLCSAPSAFQQITASIIKPVRGAVNLLDDILVYGRNVKEHDEDLHAVLQLPDKHNCAVSMQKCINGEEEVEFKGDNVDKNYFRQKDGHVEAILGMEVPKNHKTARPISGNCRLLAEVC